MLLPWLTLLYQAHLTFFATMKKIITDGNDLLSLLGIRFGKELLGQLVCLHARVELLPIVHLQEFYSLLFEMC